MARPPGGPRSTFGQPQSMDGSQHSGKKVLVIVGSSHKPFFDAYLLQLMGVTVGQAEFRSVDADRGYVRRPR